MWRAGSGVACGPSADRGELAASHPCLPGGGPLAPGLQASDPVTKSRAAPLTATATVATRRSPLLGVMGGRQQALAFAWGK